MRVAAFGASVGLSIRPPRTKRQDGNYLDILRDTLQADDPRSAVFNLTQGSNIITLEYTRKFADDISRYNPDWVILNYGINEAAPRAIPYGLWMQLHSPGDRGWIKRKLGQLLHRNSPAIIRFFKKKGWVSAEKFGVELQRLIDLSKKESLAEIIVLNIGPVNEHYKEMLPGIEKLVEVYNLKINEVVEKCGVYLLDIHRLVSDHGMENVQPDSCHFSVLGHKLVYEKILEIIHSFSNLIA